MAQGEEEEEEEEPSFPYPEPYPYSPSPLRDGGKIPPTSDRDRRYNPTGISRSIRVIWNEYIPSNPPTSYAIPPTGVDVSNRRIAADISSSGIL